MCTARTVGITPGAHTRRKWKTLKKPWQIFSPQNAPPVRDIFRYTLHGKFPGEIYRTRTAEIGGGEAGFISRRAAAKYQSLTFGRRISVGNIAGR